MTGHRHLLDLGAMVAFGIPPKIPVDDGAGVSCGSSSTRRSHGRKNRVRAELPVCSEQRDLVGACHEVSGPHEQRRRLLGGHDALRKVSVFSASWLGSRILRRIRAIAPASNDLLTGE